MKQRFILNERTGRYGVRGELTVDEITALVRLARRELRFSYMEADMGITGANFALADTGTLGLITNEGNARLVTTLPRVHVALLGLEKLLPSLAEALTINRLLPRNATGQEITSYVTWITGANIHGSEPSSRKTTHIVFLDNGRRALARDPLFSQALRCVRCGACANVCPVFRVVGGHQYGYIYVGDRNNSSSLGFLVPDDTLWPVVHRATPCTANADVLGCKSPDHIHRAEVSPDGLSRCKSHILEQRLFGGRTY